jgi:putative flippase GtrA
VKKQPKLLNIRDILAYFLVAASGLGIQLVSSKILTQYYQLDEPVAWACAYFIAFVAGFWLTKMFAFDAKQSNKTRREMIKYVLVASVAGGVMVLMASIMLDNILNVYFPYGIIAPIGFVKKPNGLIAQLTGAGFSFITNYIGHKTITFKSTGFYNRLKSNRFFKKIIDMLK